MNDAERAKIEHDVRALCDKGDHDGAATVAIRGYGGEIFGFLAAVHRDEALASDAFSLFAEGLWRGLAKFGWSSTLRTWAYAIARNVSRTAIRDAGRRDRRGSPLGSSALEDVAAAVRTETLAFCGRKSAPGWTRSENRSRKKTARSSCFGSIAASRGRSWRTSWLPGRRKRAAGRRRTPPRGRAPPQTLPAPEGPPARARPPRRAPRIATVRISKRRCVPVYAPPLANSDRGYEINEGRCFTFRSFGDSRSGALESSRSRGRGGVQRRMFRAYSLYFPHVRGHGVACASFRADAGADEFGLTLSDLLATTSMAGLRREVDAALQGTGSILILGESGSGKTLLARALAAASGRRNVVRAMLGGSDDLNTITSELFGHERGSFSGATSKRIGLVEFAHQGTLVLDELLNLPMHAQRLLLDFTQFGTYRPLGYERGRAEARRRPHPRRHQRRSRRRRSRRSLPRRSLPPARGRRPRAPCPSRATRRHSVPRRGVAATFGSGAWVESLVGPPALARVARHRVVGESSAARSRARARPRPCPGAKPPRDDAPSRAPRARRSRWALSARRARRLERIPTLATIPPESGESLSGAWQRLQAERRTLDVREETMIRRALAEAGGVVAHAARQLGLARTTLASRIEQLGIRGERATA